MPTIDANATQAACDSLVKLSQDIWTQQRYLQTVRGRPNLEMEHSSAEVVEDVAQRLDLVIAELLLALARQPETPQLRRAVSHRCYVPISQAG